MASVTSTLALAAFGRWCNGSWSAPVNAVSHWVWDREALLHHRPSLAYTAVGYAIHHGASVFWATLQAGARGKLCPGQPPTATAALITGAVAALVDLRLTPRRLTPGFDHKLPGAALVGVYACFAVGLLVGARAAHRRTLRDKHGHEDGEAPVLLGPRPRSPHRTSSEPAHATMSKRPSPV